jgi:hypothetical protein
VCVCVCVCVFAYALEVQLDVCAQYGGCFIKQLVTRPSAKYIWKVSWSRSCLDSIRVRKPKPCITLPDAMPDIQHDTTAARQMKDECAERHLTFRDGFVYVCMYVCTFVLQILAAGRLGLRKLQRFREAKPLRESMVKDFMAHRKKQVYTYMKHARRRCSRTCNCTYAHIHTYFHTPLTRMECESTHTDLGSVILCDIALHKVM